MVESNWVKHYGVTISESTFGATATASMWTGRALKLPIVSGRGPAAKRVLLHFKVKIKSLSNGGLKLSHLLTSLPPSHLSPST